MCYRQTNRQTDKQTDRQTERQTDIQGQMLSCVPQLKTEDILSLLPYQKSTMRASASWSIRGGKTLGQT